MANLTRNFTAGVMNKMVDERLIPNGQYIDALNVRMGSTENAEVGVIENSKGNKLLTGLSFNGTVLSDSARCIGAYEDGSNETIYWFVHDRNFAGSVNTGKLDLVVSYNVDSDSTIYHIISMDDGGGVNTTLNFDSKFLITAINKIEELFYFTDNHTAPKQINVNRNYPNPVAGIDGFSLESILVIKKPPITSPTIKPIETSNQDNFLEDRFISFAYRYRYEDGEYSATSQFSNPSFIPKTFDYNFSTALNDGMLNSTNACDVTYNSGGPLVKSIDLLFKDMNSSVIKIIEKINKEEDGIADDQEYIFRFDNSKIFTILSSSEILRLYDSVPLLAQAQTLMGNRLMYGNYLEGYDLKDSFDNPTQFEYTANLESEQIGFTNLNHTTNSGTYQWDGTQSIENSVLNFNLSYTSSGDQLELKSGSTINFQIRFKHNSYSGDTPFPTEDAQAINISFIYRLQNDFTDVNQLATSTDFIAKIQGVAPYATLNTWCEGISLTDEFNCSVPNELAVNTDAVFKLISGIDSTNDRIKITSSPSTNIIGLQLPAMQYVDDIATPTIFVYDYYEIETASVSFQENGNPKSLHSNRGYEIGIVYMDEYNRMSTALVSPNNTVHIPCENSDKANSIRVNIPTTQVGPYWAKRYKFVIKPDKKTYNTIYSHFFFRDPTSGYDYFLLDGQNSSKIEEGDQMIVKADTQGPLQTCARTTVLEKKSQTIDFLSPLPSNDAGNEIHPPAGTYMRLQANNFSTVTGDLPFVTYGELSQRLNAGGCPQILYPVDTPNLAYDPATGPVPVTNTPFEAYTIPEGSQISIHIDNDRRGIRNVDLRNWNVDTTFTSPAFYQTFEDWFNGENIAGALESQASSTDCTGPGYDETPFTCNDGKIYSEFITEGDDTTTPLRRYFYVKGSKGYGGNNLKSVTLKVEISVTRANGTIIFESNPADAEPDLWYESSDSYPINESGEHSGNVQDQDISANIPAIIQTSFFDCFAFGNGAESYKIQDAINGKEIVLGNRATTTNSKLYGAEKRFSDITYSGVFNTESNINKLNEFNVGLLNFKLLESSFGPIRKLFARETDILTLQEDKISYVLGGKNLLSDAGGGSALLSVPEVLGIQIARVEDFGISNNPESFAEWGPNKFFTDAKRGTVLNLKGSSGKNEQLIPISQSGMRPWFRDLFNYSFDTQKLGGFDPYMNEFVLSSNNIKIPVPVVCKNCGIVESILATNLNTYNYCYDLGNLVGTVDIDYTVPSGIIGTITLSVVYNGSVFTTGPVSTSGTLSFDKNDILVDTAQVYVEATDSTSVTINLKCPVGDILTIVLVSISADSDEGEQIHNQYRWTENTFQSPLHSETVTFLGGPSPVVSLYHTITGPQGGGVIPSNNADIKIMSNKINADTYNFNINSDNFRYLRTDTLYNNITSEIQALIIASTVPSPIYPPANGNTEWYSTFPMPATGNYLYLIWDYRDSTPIDLCYNVDAQDACCNCALASNIFIVRDCITNATFTVEDTYQNGIGIDSVVQYVEGVAGAAETFVHCGQIIDYGTVPNATLFSNLTQVCGDNINCEFDSADTCTTYTVTSFGSFPEQFCYTPCTGGGQVCVWLDGQGSGGTDSETVCAITGSATYAGPINTGGSCP